CSLWQSAVIVTKNNSEPYPNCKILFSVMEIRNGIETTITKNAYFTDSTGKAIISYTPSKPGERLKISVACTENMMESTLTVTGDSIGGPSFPYIDFELPPIETSQIAAVVFIIFAAVFIIKGKELAGIFKKVGGGRKPSSKKQEAEGNELGTRRLITDHERKLAAKFAKKHKRKEIRLEHEFLRKL
ncbi:MAG: hypothetical protein ABIF01_00910, partial [Candidatus Micrarchaeota archaeon]